MVPHEFEAWGKSIATALSDAHGHPWIAENFQPTYQRGTFVLTFKDGRGALHCTIEWPKAERLIISGNYPEGWYIPTGEMPRSIAVGMGRNTKEIGKDIVRRWLPAYFKYLARAESEVASKKQHEREVKFTRNSLARLFNVKLRDEDQRFTWYAYDDSHSTYAMVTVHGGESVQFELRGLSLDLAQKVAKLLVKETKS